MAITKRALCGKCKRPLITCYCHILQPVSNKIPLIIFQHLQETKHALGTVSLLEHSLEKLHKIVLSDKQILHNEHLELSTQSVCSEELLLLYPSPKSISLEEVKASSVKSLIVLDGTWKKSYKMWKSSSWLQNLKSCHLPVNQSSRYSLRKSARVDSYSTLEASVAALQVLEKHEVNYEPILNVLDWLMKKQDELQSKFMA